MTDKERLEEIKNSYLEGLHRLFGTPWVSMPKENFDFLIKQAERVEELELEVNDWRAEVQKWQKFYKESEESHSETKELLKSIVNQNKRYREALEEIMRTETVTTALADGQVAYTFSGHIARKALEGDND